MNTVPNIITTKDLSYLEDMLNWNFVLIKKINHYLEFIKDDDIYENLENAKKDLMSDYNSILNTLE